jgi:hypothetical protein
MEASRVTGALFLLAGKQYYFTFAILFEGIVEKV